MSDIVSSLTNAFTLTFVVTSMFALGLGSTVQGIVEPLKNVRLPLLALAANFIIVPAAAFLLSNILSLDQDLRIGLLIMGSVAGAPITIKAAQIAKGNVQFAGALVVLQVVATVIFLPLVLPRLIPGLQVDTVAIALPLILQVLLPLAAGIFINYRYDEEAVMTQTVMSEISNLSLALMIALNLTNIGEIIGLLGTGSILAALIVIVTGFASGYLLAGPDPANRRTLSIGTAQRNYAAGLTLAAGNFAERPTVLLFLLAASLISMIVVMLVAGEMGRRAAAAQTVASNTVAEEA